MYRVVSVSSIEIPRDLQPERTIQLNVSTVESTDQSKRTKKQKLLPRREILTYHLT